MNPKQKKRYTSALCERDINTILERNENDLKQAIALDKEADEVFAWCNTISDSKRDTQEFRTKYHWARNAREKANELRRGLYSRELKLRHLKETLSVLKTPTFSFLKDQSVNEQPLRT